MHNFFFFFVLKEKTLNSYLKNDQGSLTTIPHTIMVKLDQRKQNVKQNAMAGCRYNAIHVLIVFPTLYNVCI